MKLENFYQSKLTSDILKTWANNNYNVLLVGEKGVGKSTMVKEVFDELYGSKWAYFSGGTLDPWVHVIGIPRAKTLANGESEIDFVLPRNMSSDLEAIFLDEANRTNKAVKNALMELIQFKSINGRRFPNLKCVWAAVNPETTEDGISYDVELLDPAYADRFQIIVNLPNTPDVGYFVGKFKERGKAAVEWWSSLSQPVKNDISPRRLEYAVDALIKGINVTHILPKNSNVDKFVKMLTAHNDEIAWMNFKENKNPTYEDYNKVYNNKYIHTAFKKELLDDKYNKFMAIWSNEDISSKMSELNFAFEVAYAAYDHHRNHPNEENRLEKLIISYDTIHKTRYHDTYKEVLLEIETKNKEDNTANSEEIKPSEIKKK